MRTLANLAVIALDGSAFAIETATRAFKRDDWGGSVTLGPTNSNIINAITILIPGTPPASQNGELFLWPGMSNGTGKLIQTTLEQWNSNAWCGANSSQWCVKASLFGSFGQLDRDSAAVSGDDHVRIEYNRGAQTSTYGWTWTQNVTNALTGAYLSSFAHEPGPMTGWGTGTESDDDCDSTVSEQYYLNTTITLEAANTTFGGTIATAGGANYTGLTSTQNGKVWHISETYIPAVIAE